MAQNLLYVDKLVMKSLLLPVFIIFFSAARSQKIEAIYVNLYTDSLKKGTYNYINVDGKFSNGRYLPLDSSDIDFSSSAGKFSGNSLWIPGDFSGEKITIKVTLKQNPALHKEFEMHIKRKPDGPLKTKDELMEEIEHSKRKG